MDEAERCHRIIYISYGKIVARGTVPQVITQSGLSTLVVSGGDGTAIVQRLKGAPGVEQVAFFGTDLHVVGSDPRALRAAVDAAIAGTHASVREEETDLEDVFITLMGAATDNFAGEPKP
jgi:ABC-2 type transport system ATP-binding protein